MPLTLQVLAHVLTVCVTLVIGMTFGLFAPSARIVEVDSEAIMRAFSEDHAGLSNEAMRIRTSQFLDMMEGVLGRYAAQNGVIVVQAELAMAGTQDITDEAYRQTMFMMPNDLVGVAK